MFEDFEWENYFEEQAYLARIAEIIMRRVRKQVNLDTVWKLPPTRTKIKAELTEEIYEKYFYRYTFKELLWAAVDMLVYRLETLAPPMAYTFVVCNTLQIKMDYEAKKIILTLSGYWK